MEGGKHINTAGAIKHKPLGELIADEMKRQIWNKELKFGERLLETDLAEKFDVSRSTIREALRILEIEELVISKARKGTYITEFTSQDLEEITELRMIIEVRAFIEALPNLTKKDEQALEKIVEEMKEVANEGNWNKLFDLDMYFHGYVVNLCGNSRIIKIYDSLQVQIRTVLMYLNQYYSSYISFYKEHKDLFEGLRSRKERIVKEKVNNHIVFVEEKLLGGAF